MTEKEKAEVRERLRLATYEGMSEEFEWPAQATEDIRKLLDALDEAKQEGWREVMRFVVDEIFPLLDMASVPIGFKDRWNDKVKEWEAGHD